MSDVEERAAKELRRAGGRPRWDVTGLLPLVLRRQRRRAAVGAAVAVTALAGVGVVGLELFGPGAGHRAATPTPTASLTPAEAKLDAQVAALRYIPADAVFPDPRHGYALVVSCADRGKPDTCATQLAASANGGATWLRRPLPASAVQGLSVVGTRLYAVGATGLVIDQPGRYAGQPGGDANSPAPSPTAPPAWIAGQRWFSPDEGRTWSARPRTAAGVVVGVAPGTRLYFPPPDMPTGLDPASSEAAGLYDTPAQVLRADGTTGMLAGGPKGDGYTGVSVARSVDGSIWVPGYRYGDNDALTATLQVSRDGGRTFRKVTVPRIVDPPSVVTADGRNVFLVEYDGDGGARLQRSADGGRTWREIKVPAAAPVVRGPNTSSTISIFTSGTSGPGATVAPLPDGSLLVSNRTGLYRLAPGGTALRPVPKTPAIFGLIPAGDATLAFGTTGGEPHFLVTTDGTTWRPVSIG